MANKKVAPKKAKCSSAAAAPKRASSAPVRGRPPAARGRSITPTPARRKSSSTGTSQVPKRRAAAKKANVRQVSKTVLKRPARADSAASSVAKRPAKADVAAAPAAGKKQPAKADVAATAAGKKRPAKAVGAQASKRPASGLTKAALEAHTQEHMQASDYERMNREVDFDVESVITMQLNKEATQRSRSMPPAWNPFGKSPAVPASFAPAPRAMAATTASRNTRAAKLAAMRIQRPAPAPRSLSTPTPAPAEASIQKRAQSAPKSSVSAEPRPARLSVGGSSLGGNLDDMLPEGDQLRLSSNGLRECYSRAQKRRQSASRDMRSAVGMAPTTPSMAPPSGEALSPPNARRPPASPTRNPARSLSRSQSWAPAPEPNASTFRPARLSVGAECGMSPGGPGTPGGATASRMGEAREAAAHILDVRKERFASKVEWGFVILGRPSRDVLSVQKAYRTLMRPLHPDRAGDQPEVEAAVDLLRDAKELCERALRQHFPPGRPTGLAFRHICTEVGRRRFKVTWKPPESRDQAPVHRYVVAVFDPSYGKALSVGTLEPDYSQEFKRFLAYDDPELCSYVVSEEDLRKMPNLFKRDHIAVQVAAANNEGQSDWSIIRVRLQTVAAKPASAPPPARTAAPAPGLARVGPYSSAGPDADFDCNLKQMSGRELESWLQHQKKETMQGWLKKRFQQSSGSKEAVLQKIISFKEQNPW